MPAKLQPRPLQGGDLEQGWSAADSLQQIAAHRARQWREGQGLELDADFAYGVAGHHVADVSVRRKRSPCSTKALKWINKNADQELELANLQVPSTPRATGPKGQAPVAEPPLIQALEHRIELSHCSDLVMWVYQRHPKHIIQFLSKDGPALIAHSKELLLECRPEELSALGGGRESGKMALHFSSAKYAASLRVKALVWGATHHWAITWDSEISADAKQAGVAERDRLLRQDRNPVWASTNSFQDIQKRLKLSQKFVKKAEKAREAAAAAPTPKMPASLAGKMLTATLKNGQPLCPDSQGKPGQT
eukprot:s2427_g17.t1